MTFLTSFSDLARGGKSFSSSMWPGTRLVFIEITDARFILLYCNTDVVIIKPVTGRASVCSASLKTTRRLIHKEK